MQRNLKIFSRPFLCALSHAFRFVGLALLLMGGSELSGQQSDRPDPSGSETPQASDSNNPDQNNPDPNQPKQKVDPRNFTVRFPHDGNTYIGRLIARVGNQVVLQRRDGDLKYLEIPADQKVKIISQTFEPHSTENLKVQLQEEFGNRYEVSTTDRCVVVHPRGESEYWAKPFETFIDDFEYFFEEYEYELTDAPFPYIVIVLRSRGDFDRYMRAQVNITNRNATGFYSVNSNRMVTYDPTAKIRVPKEERRSWLYDSPTVLHESAHQLAFNRGIHNRLAPPSLWLAEGFATLFEARGFHSSRDFNTLKERANRTRLTKLRRLYRGKRIEGKLESLLVSDRLFRTDPDLAYSLAWGLTFYLYEKKPEEFRDYLRAYATQANFRSQPSNERIETFANHFGTDLKQLEAEMKAFYVKE